MIGTQLSNSDILIYLENNDLERLEKEVLKGSFINLSSGVLGSLELKIKRKERVETITRKDGEKGEIIDLKVQIRKEEYPALKEQSVWGIHEGYRHINIEDTTSPTFKDFMSYDALRIQRGDKN